jgi:hypothetical protein
MFASFLHASCVVRVCSLQVHTWRLAAEQAADLAEAANKRAASCECRLSESAQQLAAQARATLKLAEELKQARGRLTDRWAGWLVSSNGLLLMGMTGCQVLNDLAAGVCT